MQTDDPPKTSNSKHADAPLLHVREPAIPDKKNGAGGDQTFNEVSSSKPPTEHIFSPCLFRVVDVRYNNSHGLVRVPRAPVSKTGSPTLD